MQISDIGCCCCGIIAGFVLAVLLLAGAAGAYLWYTPDARTELLQTMQVQWKKLTVDIPAPETSAQTPAPAQNPTSGKDVL